LLVCTLQAARIHDSLPFSHIANGIASFVHIEDDRGRVGDAVGTGSVGRYRTVVQPWR
jgi:hypothetical protein